MPLHSFDIPAQHCPWWDTGPSSSPDFLSHIHSLDARVRGAHTTPGVSKRSEIMGRVETGRPQGAPVSMGEPQTQLHPPHACVEALVPRVTVGGGLSGGD